jgi:L-threonylcarbamoyladenylate synthase
MDAKEMQIAIDLLGGAAPTIAVYSRTDLKIRARQLLSRRMPLDAAQTAQQLFAVLREFDQQGVKLIWIETPPIGPEWDAVRDRLQRAAA